MSRGPSRRASDVPFTLLGIRLGGDPRKGTVKSLPRQAPEPSACFWAMPRTRPGRIGATLPRTRLLLQQVPVCAVHVSSPPPARPAEQRRSWWERLGLAEDPRGGVGARWAPLRGVRGRSFQSRGRPRSATRKRRIQCPRQPKSIVGGLSSQAPQALETGFRVSLHPPDPEGRPFDPRHAALRKG